MQGRYVATIPAAPGLRCDLLPRLGTAVCGVVEEHLNGSRGAREHRDGLRGAQYFQGKVVVFALILASYSAALFSGSNNSALS